MNVGELSDSLDGTRSKMNENMVTYDMSEEEGMIGVECEEHSPAPRIIAEHDSSDQGVTKPVETVREDVKRCISSLDPEAVMEMSRAELNDDSTGAIDSERCAAGGPGHPADTRQKANEYECARCSAGTGAVQINSVPEQTASELKDT